jgi:hypothetical protein
MRDYVKIYRCLDCRLLCIKKCRYDYSESYCMQMETLKRIVIDICIEIPVWCPRRRDDEN